MVIYSEKTKKEYKSVDECVAEESEYDKKQEEKRLEAQRKAEIKDDREKAIREAYNKVEQATKDYYKLLDEYYKDYGKVIYRTPFNTMEDLVRHIQKFF